MGTRAEFLAARQTGIGGSDCAAVMGLDPYKSAAQLYYEKRGEIEPDDVDGKPAVVVGRGLEDFVAQQYSHRMAVRVERYNNLIRHPRNDWQIANIDRLVWQDGRRPQHQGEIRTRLGLECKTALGRFINPDMWGPEGTDQVPEPYLFQCLHYMAVTGAERWDLAVLLTGPEIRIYHVERDDELLREITAREAEFWRRVQAGEPPALDCNHATTPALLAKLYPGTNGQEMAGDESLQHWLQVRQEAKEVAKRYDAAAEAATCHLMAAMGEFAVMRLPDGSACTRKRIERAGYAVEPCEYIDFRVKKAKD